MDPGNTPTGVGKTAAGQNAPVVRRKHPHGRGEDTRCHFFGHTGLETPPRAWGRLVKMGNAGYELRNTPTGVGKTFPAATSAMEKKKHPHGRGEDRLSACDDRRSSGNTPTGVGKTLSAMTLQPGF